MCVSSTNFASEIEACGNKTPVLTGYFGFVPNGIIQSIGRGYTDLTAALAAAAINASELQIWKEVDGVYSADPRKVEDAEVLSTITPEEAAELTYYGSEVIHPFTMEQVMRAGIAIRIKNTLKPELPGTVIDPSSGEETAAKPATAVTVKSNVSVININSNSLQSFTEEIAFRHAAEIAGSADHIRLCNNRSSNLQVSDIVSGFSNHPRKLMA